MLTGNLRTMGLPEILQWISAGRKSGTLELERGLIRKKILFSEGNIHSSWSNDPRESLGQFLIRTRRVSEQQLFKALLRQEKEGRLLGTLLIEEGLLDEATLRRALRDKAQESIYDVFLWTEAQFEFKDGLLPLNISVYLDMPVTAVILEGIRRVDEWARIREVLPSLRARFRLRGAPMDVADEDRRQALGLVARGLTLAEIGLEMRRSEFEAASLLFSLHREGLVEVAEAGEQPGAEEAVGAIRDLLGEAYGHLQAQRFEEAGARYEQVLAIDRLNQHAKKGLLMVSEARAQLRAARLVPRDKVPFLTVDFATLTSQNFDPLEGFVLSRVNDQWDVQSILKLCPIAEEQALAIFSRLLERGVIELRDP